MDYIIDGVGKSTFTKDLEAVRLRGCICLFGSSSGPADLLAPNSLQAKSLTICSGSLHNHVLSRQEVLRRAHDVMEGLSQGWLKLRIDSLFPLADAAAAQRLLESRQTMGKVILRIE